MKFTKILKAPFFTEHLWWLLLKGVYLLEKKDYLPLLLRILHTFLLHHLPLKQYFFKIRPALNLKQESSF